MRPARVQRRQIGAAILAAAGLLGGAPAPAPVPASPAPGPACQARPEPADAAAVQAFVESLRRHAARRQAGREPVVGLDNRGYAYGPAPHPFTQIPAPDPR